MTIYVNIGEAKTRLSELVSAVANGGEVVVNKAGVPKARIVPVAQVSESAGEAIVARRLATLGIWKGLPTEEQSIVPPSMTEEELDERWNRKFGPAA